MDATSKSFLDVESDRTGLPSCPSSRLDFDQQVFLQGNQSSEGIFRHITTTEPLQSLNKSDTMIAPTAAPPMSMCSPAVDDDGRVSFIPQGRHAVPPLSLMERSTGLPATPRKTPTSVSRLCFPFVTTSRRKKTPPSAPTRHKYSCFPTKLSPFLAGRRAPVHQRHNYHHHGYSLVALEHVKSFWSMREQGNTENSPKAYGKISPSGITTVHFGTRLREMALTQQAPVPSIHPRHGDIPALRDPYCVEVDRHFISVPSWTLVKMLWTYDLHLAAEGGTRLHIYWDEDISDAYSEPDWDISRSTSSCNFSDDSEATLVDSETESEISFLDEDKLVIDSRKFLSTQMKDGASSIFTTGVVSPLLSPFPSQLDLEKITQPPSAPVGPIGPQSSSTKPSWASNWHNRWEILKSIHSTSG